MKNVIKVDGINLSINEKHILKDINCQLESGRIVVILGPNGSGKTTFLKTIKGLYKYDTGKIFVDERETDSLKDAVIVFDEPILYEELTGNEHVKFVRELSNCQSNISKKQVDRLIELLELGSCMNKLISTYSLGTKKKIQFLCALINNPKILLMDEYISGLDPQVLYDVKKVMKEYVDRGNFILLSTHMLDMAEKFCDDVMLVKEGRIIGDGVVGISNILSKYKSLEEYYIKMMNMTMEK